MASTLPIYDQSALIGNAPSQAAIDQLVAAAGAMPSSGPLAAIESMHDARKPVHESVPAAEPAPQDGLLSFDQFDAPAASPQAAQPADRAEYDALPAGSIYRHPDGSLRRKG